MIVLSIASREPAAVFCSFYIRHDKALFAQLLAHRDEIEAVVGAALEWRDVPENKSSQVVLRKDGDWLVSTAGKFAEVFPRYL